MGAALDDYQLGVRCHEVELNWKTNLRIHATATLQEDRVVDPNAIYCRYLPIQTTLNRLTIHQPVGDGPSRSTTSDQVLSGAIVYAPVASHRAQAVFPMRMQCTL